MAFSYFPPGAGSFYSEDGGLLQPLPLWSPEYSAVVCNTSARNRITLKGGQFLSNVQQLRCGGLDIPSKIGRSTPSKIDDFYKEDGETFFSCYLKGSQDCTLESHGRLQHYPPPPPPPPLILQNPDPFSLPPSAICTSPVCYWSEGAVQCSYSLQPLASAAFCSM